MDTRTVGWKQDEMEWILEQWVGSRMRWSGYKNSRMKEGWEGVDTRTVG